MDFSFVAQDAIEDEDGDYRGKDDREHRTISEHEKNRVTWNTERRSYLEGSAVKRFVHVCVSGYILLKMTSEPRVFVPKNKASGNTLSICPRRMFFIEKKLDLYFFL